ncbi:16S rRNA (cytosine(967)-C(5))-methyltransferase RsmB [Trichlorobacter sp.]|uniref:16S rRNA (cytosine(967)-C(5))-methyltransferase RsmB n=1 Tax=Trichlorobacter sp. TaxID=2911007 RepID=UPI002A363168|nr:16S rRNA (cytosine(967)-C(5))-methyltransferase RsmB [Trichlorobacter sp.]MDY0383749.1 16S rRNA (cytosine(967)-C(5))-methyltransferase RsmB [Trichlorobacter sp.]
MQTSAPVTSSSPRHAAYLALERLSGSDLHADDLIDQQLSRGQLAGPDRGLFSELVFGVLRQQATLDHYLAQLVDQPLAKLQLPVLLLLRLGLYQLRYLDRVPSHAAVHESVELAKRLCPKASGLVNGVLRAAQRRSASLTLPDQALDPVGWLAAAYSLPDWLAAQWLEQFPLPEATGLAVASLEPPLLTLRTNTLRTTRQELLALLAAQGIAAQPCRYAPEGVQLLERCFVPDLPGFGEGLFAVQDEASQLVAHLLDPQPGETVLDVCAAPGGKATHLAQLMHDQGRLVATDLNQRKVRKIEQNAARLGIACLQVEVADALQPAYQQGRQFDRILLDAPCSGLGVIRRNPEAKWRLQPADFERFAQRQRQLLQQVAPLVRPGGLLVYATCSTSPQEDEAVVEEFLSRHRQFVVENGAQVLPAWGELFTPAGHLRTWPHRQGCDGFFSARLKRITA